MAAQRTCLTVALCLCVMPGAGLLRAQEEGRAPLLDLALNTAENTESGGCRLTFVIRNGLDASLDKLVAEAVLFDTDGHVITLTLFDFGGLPEGRPRVRQFDLAGQSCDTIGAVLINDIATCEGAGLAPGACVSGLRLSTRTAIEVTG